jgi:bifunctional DNA-binding transcriptional regulator/antitoxin component of YhaV-PrlF toxin-antitoxin module
MLAKKTSKNQITLPKKIASQFPDCRYFDITAEDGRIVLRPVDPDALGRVQRKLKDLGIRERDVDDAVAWARERAR